MDTAAGRGEGDGGRGAKAAFWLKAMSPTGLCDGDGALGGGGGGVMVVRPVWVESSVNGGENREHLL